MIENFQSNLTNNFPYLFGKKLLLATSGGLDSMVMAHLFKSLNFEFALAHCNFQLRGKESLEDQFFVQNYAEANDIPVFIRSKAGISFFFFLVLCCNRAPKLFLLLCRLKT
jgi:tRNA(Ile)-lysidine synthase